MRDTRRPPGLLVPLVAATLLAGCTTETGSSSHSKPVPRATIGQTAVDAGAASQSFAFDEASTVEREVTAFADAADASASATPPPAKPKFDLWEAVKESNRRAGKPTSRQRAARLRKPARASTRIASRSVAGLPGVRRPSADVSEVRLLPDGLKHRARSAVEKAKVRVASAAALAGIGGRNLRTQHAKVSVGCLKPELVAIIRRAERHFGRHAVVTSGYRSPKHNRRVGGARRSMHTSCKAADIQIAGVTKWKLASWLRAQPERGGVGTYCHTRSVHIDVGEKRDWNWRCKRRRKRRA